MRKKTQVIKFTRFETENSNSFTFLGFEYRWGLVLKWLNRRTQKKSCNWLVYLDVA